MCNLINTNLILTKHFNLFFNNESNLSAILILLIYYFLYLKLDFIFIFSSVILILQHL